MSLNYRILTQGENCNETLENCTRFPDFGGRRGGRGYYAAMGDGMMGAGTQEAGPELDARIAEMRGWTAYRERRGDYHLAVSKAPGECEPWENEQNSGRAKGRYTLIACGEALSIGFYGRGFPPFSTDWAAAGKLLEETGLLSGDKHRLILWHDRNGWVMGDSEFTVVAMADTGPLVVCRALEAVVEESLND